MDKLSFYLQFDEPLKTCFLIMRDLVLNADQHIEETVKYRMPCFTYKGKSILYLWWDKKKGEPYFLIVDGNRIEHPSLVAGKRKRMKIFPVNPTEDFDIDAIRKLMSLILNLYR